MLLWRSLAAQKDQVAVTPIFKKKAEQMNLQKTTSRAQRWHFCLGMFIFQKLWLFRALGLGFFWIKTIEVLVETAQPGLKTWRIFFCFPRNVHFAISVVAAGHFVARRLNSGPEIRASHSANTPSHRLLKGAKPLQWQLSNELQGSCE